MTLYHYKGPGKLKRVGISFTPGAKKLVTPVGPDVPGAPRTVYKCDMCECTFITMDIFNDHFSAEHPKDSVEEHCEATKWPL